MSTPFLEAAIQEKFYSYIALIKHLGIFKWCMIAKILRCCVMHILHGVVTPPDVLTLAASDFYPLQAFFLRAVSELLCHHLHDKVRGQLVTPPPSNPRMAGKPFNPLVDFLNTELFQVKRFTSVEK